MLAERATGGVAYLYETDGLGETSLPLKGKPNEAFNLPFLPLIRRRRYSD